jgi:uncharacterized membrane protein
MSGTRTKRATYLHPVTQKMVDEAPLGARIADRVTGFMGSWKFIVIQTVIVAIWISINIGILAGLIKFDPYPFILLNLAFSTQAAYAAPLILLASNRTAQSDRLTLEHAASEADIGEKQNDELLRGNTEILKRIVALEEQILTLEKDDRRAAQVRSRAGSGALIVDLGVQVERRERPRTEQASRWTSAAGYDDDAR